MQEITDFKSFVMVAGSKVVTDSRKVAKAFSKRHDNVLASIRRLIANLAAEDALLNFKECFEINGLSNGKPEPVYEMTKNGFMWLVMGFTGKKAMDIKVAYTKAFDAMSDYIANSATTLLRELVAVDGTLDSEERKASECGRGLNRSKYTRPPLRKKIAEIKAKLQPSLPFLFT